MVATGWGRRAWGDGRLIVGSCMSVEFQLYKERRALEVGGGDAHTTL